MPDRTTSLFVVPPVHSTARVLAVCTFAVLACLGSATRALGAADIEVLSETGTSLSMRFTAATGAQQTINFTRSSTEDVWKGPSQVGGPTPGITFGNTSPQFALPSTLRALGITPEQAVRTFDSSIANRTFDDLTIYQLCEQGEMAVALWQQGRITNFCDDPEGGGEGFFGGDMSFDDAMSYAGFSSAEEFLNWTETVDADEADDVSELIHLLMTQ